MAKKVNKPVEQPKEENVSIAGRVVNCDKLNIREAPKQNARVLCTVPKGTKLVIDTEKSVDGWYNVYNSMGLNGFCMKEYVEVTQ